MKEKNFKLFNELKAALLKKSNRGLLVYLLFNFLIIWLIIGTFLGNIIMQDIFYNMGLDSFTNTNAFKILSAIFSIVLTAIIYYLSLISSLTKFGEWILRKKLRAKEIVRKRDKERLYPIYNEVYERVAAIHPEVSKNIKLFITYDNTPNACAAGQNTIIVTTGLLSLNDEQIKGILAHEFGHIVNKDTTLLLLTNVGNLLFTIYTIIIGIFTAIFIATDEEGDGTAIIGIAIRFIMVGIFQSILNAVYLLALKSSRDNEYEADRFAAKLGYGDELIEALDIIAGENYSKGIMETLASTHPETNLRIANIEDSIDNLAMQY